MRSVSENLKERRESVHDKGLQDLVDEALENQDVLMGELNEPTLKHGGDTVNYENILGEGLVPGSENSSVTGESGSGEEVAFSTSFPVALRYAELTEACRQDEEFGNYTLASGNYGSVEDPMVVELPVSEVDEVSVDSRNDSTIESVLGVDANPRVVPAIISSLEDPGQEEDFSEFYEGKDHLVAQAVRGDEEAGEVVKALLGDTYGETGALRDHGVFRELSHDEVNGDFLQEVNTPYAPVNEEATVYVPASKVDRYRKKASEQGFGGQVHSIEARALVHEERMKEVYDEEGTVCFEHPADTGKAVNFFGTDGKTAYDESKEVIDVSRVRGKPVYDQQTLI